MRRQCAGFPVENVVGQQWLN